MEPAEVLERLRRTRQPCIETLGGGHVLEVDPEAGRIKMRFEAGPSFCHSGDIIQGGFITGMVDSAMAHAAIVRGHFSVAVPTLELKISFFSPGRPGTLIAEGWVVRWGRSTAFLEGSLTNADGETIAKASSTVRLVPGKPQRQ
jgi:uncharacterized protein (TIGR00369 family)